MKKPKKSKTSAFTFFDFLIEMSGRGFTFGIFLIPVLITFLSWVYFHFLVIIFGPVSFYLTYKWLRHVYEREVNNSNNSQLQTRAQRNRFWLVVFIIVAIIGYISSKYFIK
jgi:1,4-dihydroxy-2-naphthoate octaprenyltransferase